MVGSSDPRDTGVKGRARVEGEVRLCWGADRKVKCGVRESEIALTRRVRAVRGSRAVVRG